ncbi:MAG: septum formation initiator family protein [Hyphomicrobiales bacterium]
MRIRFFDLAVTVGCLTLGGYIGWHIQHGPRSLENRAQIEEKIAGLEKQRDDIRQERQRLEKKVALLRPDSVDPDLLDELARGTLGYGAKGDIVLELHPLNPN